MKRFVVLGAVMMTLAACGGDGSSSGSGSYTSNAVAGRSATVASTSTAGKAASAATTSAVVAQTPTQTKAPAQTQSAAQAVLQWSVAGTPVKTATVDNWYEFKPTVNSGNGKVTFSIANAPRWAAFNSATGELSGTPEAEDVGTYANITIAATDGTRTVTLSPYSIAVTRSAANSIALTWSPPGTNTDETPLTNLAGYRIYYGHDADSMTQSVDVANPKAGSFELANLPTGEWYVSMVAYSADGTVSSSSAPLKVTI